MAEKSLWKFFPNGWIIYLRQLITCKLDQVESSPEAVIRRYFPWYVLWKISNIFTGKHLCWTLIFTKLLAFRPATLLKRDFNSRNFSCEICEIDVLREKKKLKNIDDSKFNFNAVKWSYIYIKVSAHIIENYGKNVRDPSWIKLLSQSPFTQLPAFRVSKKSERDSTITITRDEDL